MLSRVSETDSKQIDKASLFYEGVDLAGLEAELLADKAGRVVVVPHPLSAH